MEFCTYRQTDISFILSVKNLFDAEMKGTGHGDIEAIDVIQRQHGDGHLLSGPRRGEDELWVIGAEGVAPRHQVVLGQGDPLNTKELWSLETLKSYLWNSGGARGEG